MHQSALLGRAVRDAKMYGWDVPEAPTHSWPVLPSVILLLYTFCSTGLIVCG